MDDDQKKQEFERKKMIYDNLKDSNFKQQKIASWRPEPTTKSTTLTFIISGFIFLILGIVRYLYSNKVQELEIDYTNCEQKLACTVNFNLSTNFQPPIFVFYRVGNFYQNYRKYVRSKSPQQLNGQIISDAQLKMDCAPIITMNDLRIYQGAKTTLDGTILSKNAPASPCGLMAATVFNGKFKF